MKTRSGRKRTAKARKNLLDEIHRLSSRGFSQSEIARKLALSQPQISRDLKTIARLRSPQDATEKTKKTKRRARLLAKMQHAEKELWAAWELSKQDKETSTKEKILLPGCSP